MCLEHPIKHMLRTRSPTLQLAMIAAAVPVSGQDLHELAGPKVTAALKFARDYEPKALEYQSRICERRSATQVHGTFFPAPDHVLLP